MRAVLSQRRRQNARGRAGCRILPDRGRHRRRWRNRAVCSHARNFRRTRRAAAPRSRHHDFTLDGNRAAYDAAFPGKLNYAFQHGGWQFLALDSTQGTDFDETNISAATLAWLDATLPKLDASAPTVAFTHFPLGKGVTYRPLNADAVLARLGTLNLRATFSGHWHGLNEQRLDHADLIVSRCCSRVRGNRDGSPLKGWWVCHATPDGTITHKFSALPIEKVEIP